MKCPHCGKNTNERPGYEPDMDRILHMASEMQCGPLLNAFENQFLGDMKNRLEKYGAKTMVSEKQVRTLAKIWEKVQEHREPIVPEGPITDDDIPF